MRRQLPDPVGAGVYDVYTGAFLKNADEIGDLVVSVSENRPVFLRDIARIEQGASETRSIVHASTRGEDDEFVHEPAVTVAVAKKRGTNAVTVAAMER